MEKQLITFNLLEEEFGIDILYVDGIHRLKEISITRVPQSEDFIEGIINLRGQVIPVIDLRRRFSLGSSPQDRHSRIIVVIIKDKPLGLLVDRVKEVVDVDEEVIDDPPEEVSSIDKGFINGIAKLEQRLIIILDIEHILSAGEKEVISELVEEVEEKVQDK